MTKEDLQNRIEQVAYDGATDGCNQAVIEREAEKLASEVVKLFAIQNVGGCFSFAKYVNGWYEYADSTENGDVYNNLVTGRLMTEQQIFDEWLKLNNR